MAASGSFEVCPRTQNERRKTPSRASVYIFISLFIYLPLARAVSIPKNNESTKIGPSVYIKRITRSEDCRWIRSRREKKIISTIRLY